MDNLLFIDIETIPGETMPDIEEVKLKAPKTMSKSETIDKWAAENQIEIYKKQALDSMQGRIICIGLSFQDQTFVLGHDESTEKGTLNELEVSIKGFMDEIRSPLVFVGWNISGFDIPWLWRKSCQHNLQDLRKVIPKDNRAAYIDLMKVWAADYKDYVSLDNCAKFLGIEHETESGSCVYDWWQAGEIDKITEHCRRDIETTIKIYERICE